MTVTDVEREISALFPLGPDTDMRAAATGEPVVKFINGQAMLDGESIASRHWATTPEAACATTMQEFQRYLSEHGIAPQQAGYRLYWRARPEMCRMERGERFYVRMRLLVSNVEVVADARPDHR